MTGLVSGPIVWKYGACVGSGTFRGGGGAMKATIGVCIS